MFRFRWRLISILFGLAFETFPSVAQHHSRSSSASFIGTTSVHSHVHSQLHSSHTIRPPTKCARARVRSHLLPFFLTTLRRRATSSDLLSSFSPSKPARARGRSFHPRSPLTLSRRRRRGGGGGPAALPPPQIAAIAARGPRCFLVAAAAAVVVRCLPSSSGQAVCHCPPPPPIKLPFSIQEVCSYVSLPLLLPIAHTPTWSWRGSPCWNKLREFRALIRFVAYVAGFVTTFYRNLNFFTEPCAPTYVASGVRLRRRRLEAAALFLAARRQSNASECEGGAPPPPTDRPTDQCDFTAQCERSNERRLFFFFFFSFFLRWRSST